MSKAVPASEGKIPNRTSPEQSRSLSASNWTKARVADSALNAFENAMTNKRKTDSQSSSTSTAQPATQPQQTAKVSTNLPQPTSKSVSSSNYVASPGSSSRANVESASADTRTSAALSSSGGSSRNRSSISPTSDAALAMPTASPVRHSTSTSSSLNASGSATSKALPTQVSINVSGSNSQEQPNSPSFLIQHSAQQLQLLESRFKFLTQTLKEKVAQPLFGVDTHITKSNEADAATAKIQELNNFYSSLASLLSRQLDAHRKMVEVERELGLFFLEKGLKEQEGPLRTSLIEIGIVLMTIIAQFRCLICFIFYHRICISDCCKRRTRTY
ncbi:hypothetical protein BKA69DRAFT_1081452 [Paraphysoderma sedebokerense]|nr:hypothetical protein BKA69DRAFT_1081452 [Paraphysoderma sedebokerense]